MVQVAEIVESNIARMLEHLLPNVLQRTHPVPIGSQTIKAETHPACGLVVNVKTFVNLVRINGWSQSIGPANEEHSTDHSDHDDQAQGDSLQAFVVHLLFKISAAEDECCRRKDHDELDKIGRADV